MAEILKELKELIVEIEKVSPMGIAALALLVALSAIWILGAKS